MYNMASFIRAQGKRRSTDGNYIKYIITHNIIVAYCDSILCGVRIPWFK